jgi:YD repeat-containing protein
MSVTRNDGLQLRIGYPPATWGVTGVNAAVDYCDALSSSCTWSTSWPQSQYTYTYPSATDDQFTLVDQGGAVTRLTLSGPAAPLNIIRYISGYKPASSASQNTVTYQYCDTPQSGHWLCIASKDGFSWQYNLANSVIMGGLNNSEIMEGHTILTSQGPTSNTVFVNYFNPSSGVIAPLVYSLAADGTRRVYDATAPTNRLTTVTYPEGDIRSFYYDARGNVTSATYTAKPGSLLPAMTASAGYDAVCTLRAKCNKPNWTQDANGKQTDYTYDPGHGGVLTVTAPADGNGIRPQTRYGYIQRYAWYKNSTGTVVQASTQIWLLATERYCRTSAALANGTGCAGTTGSYNDEVVTTYDYGPTSGANNLFLRGKTVAADGVTLRSCVAYDAFGNKLSETSPNANLASCP